MRAQRAGQQPTPLRRSAIGRPAFLTVAALTIGSSGALAAQPGPTLTVTAAALNESLEHIAQLARNTAAVITRASHECGEVTLEAADTQGTEDEPKIYTRYAFRLDPTQVEISSISFGSEDIGIKYQCNHGTCIHETVQDYRSDEIGQPEDVGESVESDDESVVISVGEPNHHRYINAFRHFQKLCGGEKKNPFD